MTENSLMSDPLSDSSSSVATAPLLKVDNLRVEFRTGDGVVNAVDLGVMKNAFFQSPGPSGLNP